MPGRRHLLGRIAGALVAAALVSVAVVSPTLSQMPRDSLQMLDIASPASMSLHEEATIAAEIPLIGGFNNLVVFGQRVAQNSLASLLAVWRPDGNPVGTAVFATCELPATALTTMTNSRFNGSPMG